MYICQATASDYRHTSNRKSERTQSVQSYLTNWLDSQESDSQTAVQDKCSRQSTVRSLYLGSSFLSDTEAVDDRTDIDSKQSLLDIQQKVIRMD